MENSGEIPFNIVGQRIPVTVCNPNVSMKQTKDGPKFFVQVEIGQSIWLALANSELTGMVAETEWEITHSNYQQREGPAKRLLDSMLRDPSFVLWLENNRPFSTLDLDLLEAHGIDVSQLDSDKGERAKLEVLLREYGKATSG